MDIKGIRPSWDSYFLNIALAVSKRSSCLRRNYGAVIVDKQHRVVSTGYNGPPAGAANCIDKEFCPRIANNIPKGEGYDICPAVHAEMNAILNADPVRIKDATIYVAGYEFESDDLADGHPCNLCSKLIKGSTLSEVVYMDKEGVVHRYRV